MDYFITKKIAEDGRGKAQLQEIAGPFRTVTQLIEALDTLLTHYSRKFAAKRLRVVDLGERRAAQSDP
jgi:glutaredoxin 2